MWCCSDFCSEEFDCLKWTPGIWSGPWDTGVWVLATEFWLVCKLDGKAWDAVTVNLLLMDCDVFDWGLLFKPAPVTAGNITVFGAEWKPLSCEISCDISFISWEGKPNEAEFLDIEVLLTDNWAFDSDVLLCDKVSSTGWTDPLTVPGKWSFAASPGLVWSSPPNSGAALSPLLLEASLEALSLFKAPFCEAVSLPDSWFSGLLSAEGILFP